MNVKNTFTLNWNKEILLVIGYCLLQILSNLTVAKTVEIFVFAIPIGSILYAVSFTWMDLTNNYIGFEKTKVLIKIMVVVNIIIAVWLKVYIILPTDEWSTDSFEAKAIEFVYGNYFRITIASIIAGYISGNVNAVIFHRLKYGTNTPIYVWSIVSNLFATIIDGLLFYIIAFGFEKDWEMLIIAAGSSALYKGIISLFTMPIFFVLKKLGLLKNQYSEEG